MSIYFSAAFEQALGEGEEKGRGGERGKGSTFVYKRTSVMVLTVQGCT